MTSKRPIKGEFAEGNMDITKLFINEDMTVLQAMEQLDKVALKVLFVTERRVLKAALTDGDIRRWILSGGALGAPIKNAANYQPIYLSESSRENAIRCMREKSIEAIPIVDDKLQILDIVLRDEKNTKAGQEELNLPVVMMAGGKGTRLYPYTKILPKPLIPVRDIPIAEHIINQFRKYGCRDFYLVVNHKKNMIKAYFNEIEKDYNIFYAEESKPLGTGGGLSLLKGKIHDTFILTNCDILIRENIAKIYKYHKEHHHLITMVCSLKNFRIPYGVVDIGQSGEIVQIKEKPQLSFFTNTGCYIVEPRVIEELPEDAPIDFPRLIEGYKQSDERIGVYPIGENAWLDMGQMDLLQEMENALESEEEKGEHKG